LRAERGARIRKARKRTACGPFFLLLRSARGAPRSAHSVAVRRFLGSQRGRELDQHRAEVCAVAQEMSGAAASSEQKRDRREISLGRVAGLAREDEIVAPIVGGLAAPRGNVVERHCRGREALTAVGADGPMSLEEPPPSLGVGDASGRMRRQLEGPVRCAALGALLSSSATAALRPWMRGVGQGFLLRPATSMMMVRRTALDGALLWPFVAVGRVVKISRQT